MPIQFEHCRLNERDHARYYRLIVSELFTGNTISDQPRAVLLGGQPGSGKTKMRELAMKEFSSVVINADDLREYHPMYDDLKLKEPERASFLVNEDVSLWTGKLIRQAVDEKRNIIFDGTFGTSDTNLLSETLNLFRENGYESQLWVLAVPAEFSKLGIYLRNEMQIAQTGSGRFVSMKVHDLNYRNISSNIEMAVKDSLVDQVCIFTRSVEQLNDQFVNNKVKMVHSLSTVDSNFKESPGLFLQIRNEPLSAVLKSYFSIRFNEVVSMIDRRLNRAMKANNRENVPTIAHYKDQFLKDLGMNKKEDQEINSINLISSKSHENSIGI
jgi:predicted ABC-type ATPase